MSIIRYLFPRRNPIYSIPLRTRVRHNTHNRYGEPPDGIRADLRIVAGALAISESNAYLLHLRNPSLTRDQLILKYRRRRKRAGALRRAWARLRRWWG